MTGNILLIILILFILATIIYIYFNDPVEKLRQAESAAIIIQKTDCSNYYLNNHKDYENHNINDNINDDQISSITLTLTNTISNSKNNSNLDSYQLSNSNKQINKCKIPKRVRFNDIVTYKTYSDNNDNDNDNDSNNYDIINSNNKENNLNNFNDNLDQEEKWDSVFTCKLSGDAKWDPNLYVPCLNSYQVDPKSTIIDPTMVLQKIDISTDRIQGSKDKMGMKIKDIYDQQTANTKAVPKQLITCNDSSWEYANESELNGGILRNSPGLKGYGSLEDFFQGISYANDF
jgi:Tfp pilus assembly protein PilE